MDAAQGASSGNPADEAEMDLYYYSDGRRIPLTLATDKVGIYFDPDLEVESLEAFVAADGDFAELDEREFRRGLRIVHLRDGLDPEALLAKVRGLTDSPLVNAASPVFTTDGEDETLLTDTFIVSFQRDATDREIDALNRAYDVEVVKVKEYRYDIPSRYLLHALGASTLETLNVTNGYYEDPLTRYAVPNFLRTNIFLQTEPDDTYYPEQWHLEQIDAPLAWDTESGDASITVAVLDMGVDHDHEDIEGNRWQNTAEVNGTAGVDDDSNGYIDDFYGWDFFMDDGDPSDSSGYGHGTCCAGLAAAVANNGIGVAGVAWEGRLMALEITDALASHDDELADAIDYAWENGADILSCSWGWSPLEPSGVVNSALHNARLYGRGGLGSVLVFAAGNEGNDDPALRYPANQAQVIAVGATQTNDHRADFSCFGEDLDVVAPGVSLWTTDITGTWYGQNGWLWFWRHLHIPWGNGNYFDDFTGTSGACPIVAGLVGLVLSSAPSLTAAQVQAAIQFSAEDLVGHPDEDTPGRDEYMGYGRVNAVDALELAQTQRFVISDGSGRHIASFDDRGNFVLENLLREEEDPALMGQDPNHQEVIIRAGTVNVAKLVDFGLMFIRGRLYESVDADLDTGVAVPCLRIRNGYGVTVALINSASFTNSLLETEPPYVVPLGSIVLKGRAFIGFNPDESARQGH